MCSLSFAGNMEDFLRVREDLYRLRNNGLATVPILNIINQNKRHKEFKRKLKYLKKLINSNDLSQRDRMRMVQLLRFDKISDFSSKNPGYGLRGDFYTTPYGIKISKSCFKLLEKVANVQGDYDSYTNSRERVFSIYSKHLLDKGLEHVDDVLIRQIELSIDQMIKCGGNYPSAQPFIQKWLKSIKNTEIICEDELSTESGHLGQASPDYINGVMTKKLYFSSDSFINFFLNQVHNDENYSESRETFIHEVFHLSLADNRAVSNHAGYTDDDLKDDCDAKDKITDRVYLLSALCSGKKTTLPESTYLNQSYAFSADELINHKINKCGLTKGCVDHFIDGMNTKEHAIKFCKNVSEMGKCRSKQIYNMDELPKVEKKIFQKMVKNLYVDFEKCKAYLRSKRKSVVRPQGCPARKYLERPSNAVLKDLYFDSYNFDQTLFSDSLEKLEKIKYLKNHPRTNKVLSSLEWEKLIKVFRERSYFGISKLCSEKIKIKSTVHKMYTPLKFKVQACILPM